MALDSIPGQDLTSDLPAHHCHWVSSSTFLLMCEPLALHALPSLWAPSSHLSITHSSIAVMPVAGA